MTLPKFIRRTILYKRWRLCRDMLVALRRDDPQLCLRTRIYTDHGGNSVRLFAGPVFPVARLSVNGVALWLTFYWRFRLSLAMQRACIRYAHRVRYGEDA